MFDTAELGQTVSADDFAEREEALRTRLLLLQHEVLSRATFPVLIDFAGVNGAGKGTTVNMLNKWMDPRWVRTVGYRPRTEEERARPRFWRYWRDLPPKGRIGLFLSGRYSRPLLDYVAGELDDTAFDRKLGEIIRFENALVDDGALVLKFWMHLSGAQQRARLEALEADPLHRYRVTAKDWENQARYDDFVAAAEKIVTRTNRAGAEWNIVEGLDPNHRHLQVGETIAAELERHLAMADADAAATAPDRPAMPTTAKRTVFDTLDHDKAVPSKRYRERRKAAQARLGALGQQAFDAGQSTVLVFEGPDAAGKGGAIRRTVWSLDARSYRVHQFAAPTDVERAHHYLWRFWRRLPRAGHFAVFDRSWYGRVLVERAEGFASESEWRRAYNEINDFEQQLVDHGIVLLKFWLHISKDEQLKRFRKREKSPYKKWKLTDEDWRNRELFELYEQLGHDVLQYTSTHDAPWIVVEANDKRHARLEVLDSIADHLEAKLAGSAED
jgi:polyphosphate:AMP phosphotransferase